MTELFYDRASMLSVLITLLISTSAGGTAQDSTSQACIDARIAAPEETSATAWFFTGCMPNGLATATNEEPQPHASALVGKQKDYIDRYIECYQREARTIRKRWAQIGCMIGFPLQIFSL